MSWIKKLLHMFKDEESEYLSNRDEFAGMPNPEIKKRRGKDIETRVAYHYPKGQFRFPVIPDEKESQPPSQSRTERMHKKNRPVTIQQKREQQSTLHKNRMPTVSSQASQPFRPVEIPPVFGFGKQSKDEAIIHEISSFEPNNSQLTEIKYRENIKADSDVAARETPNSGSAILQGKIETDRNPIFESDSLTIQDGSRTQRDAFFEQAAAPSRIFQVESEPVSESETLISEGDSESRSNSIFENEVPDIQRFEAAPVADKTVDDLSLKDGEQQSEPQAPQSQKERPHLPFNVLMLKQDKQKLEENQFPLANKRSGSETGRSAASYDKSATEMNRYPAAKEAEPEPETAQGYTHPDFDLLEPPVVYEANDEWLYAQEQLLNETLENFNVGARVVNVVQGPSVTRFEVQPDPGVKVNKITNLSDDIKLSLAAKDIRIEAPIPGKHTIGIEVPNEKSRPVLISEIIKSREFTESVSPLTAVLGLDISGLPIITDLKKMPHGLIAGATGSGKSVCINTILVSLLYKADPDQVKLLLIDPKMVELAPYNHIPHLVCPVITDVKAATAALKWAVEEMERRYELFAHTGVRDINRFNEMADQHKRYSDKLPFIVIIIDELADLMMMSPADVEEAICRIAQKARACGIHLIIATQRPSVDVITGLIKANVPTRIAFSVSSQIDSRTIIDISGAEKLLGRGDMLFLENGSSKPVRLQGTYVSDLEIDDVVSHVRAQREPVYLFEQGELLKKAEASEEEDELFYEACEFVVSHGAASTSSLQRRFKIGYNRAARLIDMMEQHGYISETRGSKPRDVLITETELAALQDTSPID
ncbi:DNA translocase FtsK [Bacillus sp. V33-4]|uniref:DNA translocase FtsK n=1 Tax=Bacillus sp. V33-4 TaxID=2054169 RepID=UPI002155D405|nr:DNA translocase FtsK [Bacillus sp. V33-4]